MKDYMVRALAQDGQIRAFAASTSEITETARKYHQTTNTATAALGRLLTAGVMIGGMQKNETDILTLIIKGDGPIGGITVTANSQGQVKGYVDNPDVILPSQNGKLDVGGAVGKGFLTVIKDIGLKEPYSGKTALINGEIAEDLTYYFASSEQIPSAVALGVRVDHEMEVMCAGGFIVQVMPFALEETILALEENVKSIDSVTNLLRLGYTPEQLLEEVFKGMSFEVIDTMDISYSCNCSKERIEKALVSIGKEGMQSMIDDGEAIEVKCQFCNKAYMFSIDELENMKKRCG